MRACPASPVVTGYHEFPKYRESAGKPIVKAAMLFPVLDAAYLGMARSR